MCFPITMYTNIEKLSSHFVYLLSYNPCMVIHVRSLQNIWLNISFQFIYLHKEMVILQFHGFLGGFELHRDVALSAEFYLM